MNSFANSTSSLVRTAHAFAVQAHYGQERKYIGGPYVAHPIAVAQADQPAQKKAGSTNGSSRAMLRASSSPR